MEDQQPAAGDLTAKDEATVDEATVAAPDDGDAEATDDATDAEATEDATDAEATEDAGEQAADAPAPAPRKRRLAGKAWAIVALVAAVLFVGSAGFAGAMVQPYLTDRAAAETKINVARTAANAITTLWTYTPENMDTLADRASAYLTGDFAAQYRKFVDAIVAPNKQAKITNHTDVTGAAVESLDDNNAVVIIYTNTTSTSPLTKNVPSLKYLSYRLFMKRQKSRWLVTRMTTITSLDLTPKT
ncbi:mammalian cell entry protein [Mycobacterium intracellulare]|uniref:Mammalian cell entry protein n=1 Tax=Mycobacterium intracellulare TaxID=1767 RepID=A0AAE4RIW0_MYCIT|nr:mammalian cell entry protein [Mycobacterium intracellulare]MCA2322410.1 mammalian cell entry protein [Mycobacterium intracellulare]MCA2342885.1 mammalian cell entry protein [Mycobacterium intracellulare]MDV6978847.1 mammalian cell entry protein [Mycobacterium intracellulare]MDV6984153.1 mammalian cell entry protein [Mycobacterium intracellulare]MDV7015722.1 mammalian cell entry protein [Mycobacterium intracellulare]